MADRLLTTGQLNVGDNLASPNGRFRLSMQGDGNLVLYQDASPYWATETEWLTPTERPTRAVMQADANFVLLDTSGTPRWTSGTWGPVFADPFLVLLDDGNLVVYDQQGEAVWASGGPGRVGAIAARGLVASGDGGGIDGFVDRCGRMAPIADAGTADLGGPAPGPAADADGVTYQITEQRRRTVNDVTEHAYLQDIAGMGVWPGKVIQGRPLIDGDIADIGPFPRQPGTVEIVTELVTTTPQLQSAEIDMPTQDVVDQARRSILTAIKPQDAAGQMKISLQQASTVREAALKANVNVTGSNFGVDANVALNQDHKKTTTVAVIRQVYYSVNFVPHNAGAGAFWHAGAPADITVQKLQPYAGIGNPPLFIDSVQYGRLIVLTVTGAYSSDTIQGALHGHYTAGISVSGGVEASQKDVIDSSDVELYTLGVTGRNGPESLGTGAADRLTAIYRAGVQFSADSPGAPISFTCKHIADNTLAHVRVAAEYTQALAAVGVDVHDQVFHPYDGPGGGPVDTGIRINPGDRLTIHAGGAIRTGVLWSGDTSPDGWPGHQPDPNAPLPKGQGVNAYMLVGRIGSSAPWFKVGTHCERVAGSQEQGVLQLVTNDNDPYNGDDPSKRWDVHVDVGRATAASVGIYV